MGSSERARGLLARPGLGRDPGRVRRRALSIHADRFKPRRETSDERPIETVSRRIVADVLGVPVEQHDDNSRPSMVDAMIHTADGPIPLEVVTDVAPAVMKQTADLGRYPDGIPLPAGSPSWMVMMTRGSRTSELATTPPPLLSTLDPSERFEKRPAALKKLGVLVAIGRLHAHARGPG